MKNNNHNRSGFSLIELVIVVVIIAIIAAIAVPKMSRGAAGANDAALAQNLAQMRSAIDLFATEHGGTYPSKTDETTFKKQLTQYSDITGTSFSPTPGSASCIYGPYLKAIPTLPVGTNKGLATITFTGPVGTGTFAWYFDGTSVYANNPGTDTDIKGNAYNAY